MVTRFDRLAVVVLTVAVAATSAAAAPCGNDESGFKAWVRDFRSVAAHEGISAATIRSAFQGVTYNTKAIYLDRHQNEVMPSFKAFAAAAIPPRIKPAEAELEKHAAALQRIEKEFGVPKEILVAIWGLETDFGKTRGKAYTIGALATLAYDCRRSEFFTAQLLDALRIIDRRDLTAKEMVGGLLGELGQTQLLPSSYYSFAVDFDGDGRADLLNSSEDALASTANYLKQHGWKAGEPWDPGTANFDVLKIWNKNDAYARVVGEFARQLIGAK